MQGSAAESALPGMAVRPACWLVCCSCRNPALCVFCRLMLTPVPCSLSSHVSCAAGAWRALNLAAPLLAVVVCFGAHKGMHMFVPNCE